MVQNANNVAIKTPATAAGALFYLPANAEVSSDPSVALPEEVKSAGYITSAGFTFSDGQEAGDGVVAFGGDTVVSGTTVSNPTVTFSILEVESKDAMALAYAESDLSGTDGALKLVDSGATPSAKTLIMEFALKNGKVERIVYRNAEFSTRGDRVIDNENPDSIEVTYNIRRDDKGVYKTSQVSDVTALGA